MTRWLLLPYLRQHRWGKRQGAGPPGGLLLEGEEASELGHMVRPRRGGQGRSSILSPIWRVALATPLRHCSQFRFASEARVVQHSRSHPFPAVALPRPDLVPPVSRLAPPLSRRCPAFSLPFPRPCPVLPRPPVPPLSHTVPPHDPPCPAPCPALSPPCPAMSRLVPPPVPPQDPPLSRPVAPPPCAALVSRLAPPHVPPSSSCAVFITTRPNTQKPTISLQQRRRRQPVQQPYRTPPPRSTIAKNGQQPFTHLCCLIHNIIMQHVASHSVALLLFGMRHGLSYV